MVRRSIFAALLVAGVLTVIGGSSSPAGSPAVAQACSTAYPDFCIPPAPDVNCPDLLPAVNFTALPPDPHGLDSDNDQIACEDASRPRFTTSTTSVSTIPTTTISTGPPSGSGSSGLSSANSGAGSDASAAGTGAGGGAGLAGGAGGGSGSAGTGGSGGSGGSGGTGGSGAAASTAPGATASAARVLALTG